MYLFPFRGSLRRHRGIQRMHRHSRQTLLCLAALACFALSVSAATAQTQYHIDAAKSKVLFSLGGFHDVKGVFNVTSGDITFDEVSGHMSGKIVVSAASGNSDNSSRDKKMRGDELHAKKHPEITFIPTQFTGILHATGDSSLQVHGLFTLIGKPHPIVVPMTVHIDGNQCAAKGNFTVPYVSWGMKDPTMMFMKEAQQVKIDLAFQGTLSEGK